MLGILPRKLNKLASSLVMLRVFRIRKMDLAFKTFPKVKESCLSKLKRASLNEIRYHVRVMASTKVGHENYSERSMFCTDQSMLICYYIEKGIFSLPSCTGCIKKGNCDCWTMLSIIFVIKRRPHLYQAHAIIKSYLQYRQECYHTKGVTFVK